MSIAKVTLRFDVLPEEKEELEIVCKSLGITKIDFLRISLRTAESKPSVYLDAIRKMQKDGK